MRMGETFVIEVFIKSNAKKTAIMWDKDVNKFVIHVKSPPLKGKANKEIISVLKDFFKAKQVILLRGETSTTKVFEIREASLSLDDTKKIL
jgi:hypothetical protein